jgi:multiple sugar transport system permease protein
MRDAAAFEVAMEDAEHAPPPRSTGRLLRSERRAGVLFVLPAAILYALLLALPIIQTFYYSLTRWNGINATFLGLDNYERLFTDPTFWRVVMNNVFLLLAIPVAILIPLAVAFLLNEHVFGWRFFRSVYFLPTAISWVVIGIVAVRFFAQRGILNSLLAAFGIPIQTDMLASEWTAMLAVTITFIWSVFGTNTIIFITGMATLDRDVYEAAKVDGAGGFATFRHITVPLLMRFIQFAFILTLITGFTALFSLIFVMTTGGPGFGTTTLEFYVYQTAFAQGEFGYAAAVGVVLFAVVFTISIVQRRLLRDRSE